MRKTVGLGYFALRSAVTFARKAQEKTIFIKYNVKYINNICIVLVYTVDLSNVVIVN